MTSLRKFFGALKCSMWHSFRNCPGSGTSRSCSNQSKLPRSIENSEVTKKEEKEGSLLTYTDRPLSAQIPKCWNESRAVKKLVKQNTFPRNTSHVIDVVNGLVSIRKNFPGSFENLVHWLQRRIERRKLIEQKFLPDRLAILRADLAAAHFLIKRGGSVRFVGQKHWIGFKKKKAVLPDTYIPGYYIEEISFENSDVYYEGLQNICNLDYLKSLTLKNLEQVNDWWLDWISSEYYKNLENLDLSGCKNVTYRGLSCFYRFDNLKTLNVQGVPDPPEFKLACVMLQDIMPKLDIQGIDLSLPEEIKAVKVNQSETLTNSNAQ